MLKEKEKRERERGVHTSVISSIICIMWPLNVHVEAGLHEFLSECHTQYTVGPSWYDPLTYMWKQVCMSSLASVISLSLRAFPLSSPSQ